MKILRLTNLLPGCIKYFYLKYPNLSEKSYAEQKTIIDYQAFDWSDYWSHGFQQLGYEAIDVISNVVPLQRAWAKEEHARPWILGGTR